MKYAYRLGRALMLPVACLPVAGLLMGIGFWMDPIGHGDSYLLSRVLVAAGKALIDNMSLLFTLGVAVGMADEQDVTISWLEFSAVCWERTAVILIGNVILMVCCMYLAENGLQF